ncbi:MAG: heme exporter protein CcmD [Rhodospirillales bacterium]|nr:heme exporter protein CcmD [Rhodospirillales bacterium]MDH3912229.1 heme exporter protein CcmD [Rhodospirillales bacterium]MDH3918107.1 heme exporter protein CcmD [Rhodospirillales bacterium]MDH3966277.1 heme exporter protein CcmD [Rhodospirillales bacterium]
MEQIESFLAMGGYGLYVWPAYGLTAAIMVAFLISTLRSLRSRKRALKALEADAPQRHRRTTA